MSKFLSKLFLVAFIVLFAVPTHLLAQNSWTPPTQPAVGGNTPSPINVSEFAQKKRGRLTIDGEGSNTSLPGLTSRSSSLLRGTSVFDGSDMPGASTGLDMMLSWVKSYFMSNVTIGSQGTVGPEIRLNGQLYYKPLALNGTISGNQPVQGALLSIVDANGKIGYTPAPANQGDTLIWDSTCGCWTTGPGGGSGSLPNGTAPWQTLSWNQTTSQWVPNSLLTVNTQQREIKSNSGTNVIDLTTNIDEDTYLNLKSPYLSISSTDLNLPLYIPELCAPNCPDPTGKVLVAQDQNGLLGWVNPGDIFTGGGTGDLPPGTQGQTLWYSAPNVLQATDKIKHDTVQTITGSGQLTTLGRTNLNEPIVNIASTNEVSIGAGGSTTYMRSPVTVFGSQFGNQDVNFLPNTNVRISKDAATGRIPFAGDNQGMVKWNENLTYNLNQSGSTPVGQLSLVNPSGGISVFQNQGISSLWDDVIIEDTGQLYLQGINDAAASQRGIGIIKPLCYVATTKKVVTCNDTPITQNPGGFQVEPAYDTDYEIFRTVVNNTGPESSYTFQSYQTVNIEFCGGGGGGGGGGAGASGHGGGGGGGGAGGNCQTLNNFPVSQGDKLTWNIGDGGNGGNGTRQQTFVSGSGNISQLASDGSAGQSTTVYIDYASDGPGNPVQVGLVQAGGLGGKKGVGAITTLPDGNNISTTTGGFLGGAGADDNLPPYHDGQNGCGGFSVSSGIQNCQGSPIGGYGGDGKNPTGSILPTTPSAGGNPGVNDYAESVTSDHWNNRTGGPGYQGNPGNGGGGGGGGYGSAQYTNVEADVGIGYLWTKWPGGGNGGKGGSGYVRVSGILNSAGASSVTFDTPTGDDIDYPVNAIPMAVPNVTIEIWGGGGAGGGVKTGFFADRAGGGGGAGGYIKIPNVPRSLLGSNLLIKVGAGGVAGISSGSSGDVTSGGTGGVSYVKVSGSTNPLASASGGNGGQKDTDNDSSSVAGGSGGQPSLVGSPLSGLPGIIQSQGSSGASGMSSLGGSNAIGGNINNGGVGARTNLLGGLSQSSTSGQNGKVRLSW